MDIPHPNPVGDNDLSRFDVVHKLAVVPTTYNTSPDPCSGSKKGNRNKRASDGFLVEQGVTTTVGNAHNLFSRIKGWRDAAPLSLAMLCVSELKAVIGTACDISVQKRRNAS